MFLFTGGAIGRLVINRIKEKIKNAEAELRDGKKRLREKFRADSDDLADKLAAKIINF